MRKDSFWKVITFVFVFVDIFLIIGLMRILKEYQKTSSMFQERQGRIEEVLNDITDVDNDLIHGLLDDEGLSLNFDPQMFMVIPASPCSACLDRESLLFEKFAKTGLVKCQILVPDYRLKDTRALFSRDLNLSINAYSLETLTNDYWRYSEKNEGKRYSTEPSDTLRERKEAYMHPKSADEVFVRVPDSLSEVTKGIMSPMNARQHPRETKSGGNVSQECRLHS